MRYLSFMAPDGRPGWGALEDGRVVDLSLRAAKLPDLRSALIAGSLQRLRLDFSSWDYRLEDIILLPTVPNPDKILCVGINYGAHAAETGRAAGAAPSMFARFTDTLVAHKQAILRPSVSSQLDYEGELAVVIGRSGRYIPAEKALDHVAGYTCFNDASIRDFQKHSVTAGKNFPRTGALGPVMVSEGIDPQNLVLTTRLNGNVVQNACTDTLIYPVADIISFASQFTTLTPGTVIATGTPAGVGSRRNPPLWMKPGDIVEVKISRIGTLSNPIKDEYPGSALL